MGVWLDLGDYSGPKRSHALVMYCTSRARQRNLLHAYRVYVTDSLQAAPEGKRLTRRYADLVEQSRTEEIDVNATIEHVIKLVKEANEE
jgi:hypothetical protein